MNYLEIVKKHADGNKLEIPKYYCADEWIEIDGETIIYCSQWDGVSQLIMDKELNILEALDMDWEEALGSQERVEEFLKKLQN